MTRSISSVYSQSSFVSSNQLDKKQRLIFDRRRSLEGFSSSKNLLNNFHRRSTITSTNLSKLNTNKINIEKINSDESINLIKEISSNSDSEKFDKNTKTNIKLKLPKKSKKNSVHRNKNREQEDVTKSVESDKIIGEFTLPTNPRITVSIESQTNLNENFLNENCFHDDQIYSPDNKNIQYEKKSINDTSLKTPSTLVTYFMDLFKPSDNKLALKLFGSRKGLLKERLRQQRAGHCIIHPCSNFR